MQITNNVLSLEQLWKWEIKNMTLNRALQNWAVSINMKCKASQILCSPKKKGMKICQLI